MKNITFEFELKHTESTEEESMPKKVSNAKMMQKVAVVPCNEVVFAELCK